MSRFLQRFLSSMILDFSTQDHTKLSDISFGLELFFNSSIGLLLTRSSDMPNA